MQYPFAVTETAKGVSHTAQVIREELRETLKDVKLTLQCLNWIVLC